MNFDQNKGLQSLKRSFESYAPITEKSWQSIENILEFQFVKKGTILLQNGQVSKELYFICKGALRTFITDRQGNTYNKNIFLEGYFAGSKASALQQIPSDFSMEALEDSVLISINYKKYRELIFLNDDLKNYYIAYLEKNWVIEKEKREISLVMENATERYLQ